MNPRNTILLLLVTGGLFAFIFFYERHLSSPEVQSLRVIPDLNPDQVSSIHILFPGQSEIRADRISNSWSLSKPISYPANERLITNLLQTAAQLAPAIRLSSEDLRGHTNISTEYGLDHPQVSIVFQQGSRQRQLQIGYFTSPGDQVYVELVGGKEVDIVDAAWLNNAVPRNLSDMRDISFIPTNHLDFDTLSVTGGQQGQMSFLLTRDSANSLWRMIKPVETRADHSKVSDLLAQLQEVKVIGFVSDAPTVDLDTFGLHPPLLEISMNNGTNRLIAAQFGKSPANETNRVYARLAGHDSIVLIPLAAITPWLAGFQEFRDRHLLRFNGVQPDEITITGPESVHLQRLSTGSWTATREGSPDALAVDASTLNGFLTNLTHLSVVRLNNEVAVKDTVPNEAVALEPYGLAKPARRYLLRCSPSALPAGSTNPVLATLDFGMEKQGVVYARRSDLPGETSVYSVTSADFQALPWKQVHFQNKQIWQFDETNVVSLSVRQNGSLLKLERKGMAKWKIAAGSQGMIDELEVEVAAEELGDLQAGQWVERTDEKRAQYGFSPAGQEIDVELALNGSTTEHRVLDLGGFSPDGSRYASVALPDGHNWIFQLSLSNWQQLEAHLHLLPPAAR